MKITNNDGRKDYGGIQIMMVEKLTSKILLHEKHNSLNHKIRNNNTPLP